MASVLPFLYKQSRGEVETLLKTWVPTVLPDYLAECQRKVVAKLQRELEDAKLLMTLLEGLESAAFIPTTGAL